MPNATHATATLDENAVRARAAWRALLDGEAASSSSKGAGCLFDCRLPVEGNEHGFGSYLNTVLGASKRAMRDLHALPAAVVSLPDALLRATPPPRLDVDDGGGGSGDGDGGSRRGAAGGALLSARARELFHSDACVKRRTFTSCFVRPLSDPTAADDRSGGDDEGAVAAAPACARLPECDPTVRRPLHRDPRVLALLRGAGGNRAGGELPFWMVAEMIRHLLRPTAAFAARLAAERAALGLDGGDADADADAAAPRPRLSMHIRRGDSCGGREAVRTGRRCAPASEYAVAAGKLAASFGFRSLLVATDSDSALDELRRALPTTPGWPRDAPVLARNDSQRRDDIRLHMNHIETAWQEGGEIEPWQEFYSFLVDVLLLAEGDGFVGKFTSNIDRIVYALMAGRAGCHRPYVSLDAAFCFGGWGLSIDSTVARNATTGLGKFPCHVGVVS